MSDPASEIASLYQSVAKEFDRDRTKNLMEKFYLHEVLHRLQNGRTILDLGCGSGEPIARFFIEAGCAVTGVDIAPAMIEMCEQRFPKSAWTTRDMRSLDLAQRFDAIIAWDSFFHLTQADQRAMFAIFEKHIAPKGLLLFTSGPNHSEVIGNMYGHALYHASLSAEDYRGLLKHHNFDVILHRTEDPDCGGHTVWLANFTSEPESM